MPISSHCFCPCESRSAGRVCLRIETDLAQRVGNQVAHVVALHRQLKIFERRVLFEDGRLLEFATDPGVGDLGLG
jgi:hypothetical protein